MAKRKTVKIKQITSTVSSQYGVAYRQRRTGLTTVELPVVIATIAVLAGILMPALNMANKKSKFAVCKSQLHRVGRATLMFAEDNNDILPVGNFFNFPTANGGDSNGNGIAYEPGIDGGFLATDVQPYLKSTRKVKSTENAESSKKVKTTDFSVFICPADNITRQSPAIFYGTTAQYGAADPQGATTEEWYKSGHLNFYSGNMSYYIFYYYFGNYPWEVTNGNYTWPESALLPASEIELRIAGLLYPRTGTGPRAKLMQDIVTRPQLDYIGLISSHGEDNPNGLFTDGSAEELALSELTLHTRSAGLLIRHLW